MSGFFEYLFGAGGAVGGGVVGGVGGAVVGGAVDAVPGAVVGGGAGALAGGIGAIPGAIGGAIATGAPGATTGAIAGAGAGGYYGYTKGTEAGATLDKAISDWWNSDQVANQAQATPVPATAGTQTQTQTGAVAATCATGNCPPPGPNCNDRNKKIKERRDELEERYNDMVEDKANIFYNHYYKWQAHPQYRSWEGHLEQYRDKQKNLARQMQDAEKAGCKIDTPDAEEWATNSPPQSPKFRYPTITPP
ncbi:hypothetical protein AB4Y96_16850 [Phyllobacterium sp. TAF24]|uniref:hypothetical protein n=1 Tax=Phyllobacterium sp. TAF24 TaxID=3233068 RepID=UPI003F995175